MTATVTAAATTASPERGSRLTGLLARLWLVPIALAAWEAGTRLAASDYFPPPSLILVRARELWFSGPAGRLFLTDEAVGDFLPSLGRMFGGWAVACVLGVGLGVAIGRSRALAGYVDPLVEFGRAIPPPALVPLFIVLFKLGTEMQVATIVYGVIWPVLINAIDGARHVDRLHVETARVFRLGRVQRLFRVVLPAAGPKVFAGLRLSVSLAVILMVLSELVGSTDGIGHQLLSTQQNFDLAGTWSVIVLLGVLGLALNGAFLVLERRVLSWHLRARQTI
ncbi:nitrate ABC transporter permease [Sphaerisporangium siamense]|uniref:ABC-type nitrate/sulfonate/bicarbonate transport system permease component n=1 Tax=Sphaerisporangium siamense TaxID=795645 RepID=A0A7W7GE07_9ACTN|nr:ABC transporter permease [Sphaerisporangium siamense]MBB4705550.1 ABC-type nitrate/sulfonate/bicarbonate transport system permease component [Sphaerisporangium siamense]GII83070.1 nitrate ABC transporter permease [Sphaerisporangium siamense]